MSRRDTSTHTVPEELRQSSQAAADLANAMVSSAPAAGAGVGGGVGSDVGEGQQPRGGDAAAPATQHHSDHVPEGLRHTSEMAAELASRMLSAISERLHFGTRSGGGGGGEGH